MGKKKVGESKHQKSGKGSDGEGKIKAFNTRGGGKARGKKKKKTGRAVLKNCCWNHVVTRGEGVRGVSERTENSWGGQRTNTKGGLKLVQRKK